MIRKAMGKIIAILMLVALIAIPLATLFFLSAHTNLAFEPQPQDIGVSTRLAVRVSESAWCSASSLPPIEQNGMSTALMETKSPG